jgi:hypoxanthine phosphoribosyltransferase
MITTDIERVLITEEEIEKRCVELAEEIEKYYNEKKEIPMVIGLLKGSVPFMAELIKRFTFGCVIDFMSVSSYEGTTSTGDVRIDKDTDISVKGRSVLVVEDIVDTGRTLKAVRELLYYRGATDVKIVSLLNKPDRRVVDIEADYVGFTIPNEFVVGYGLDYNQVYRNLPYIGVLKEEIYE